MNEMTSPVPAAVPTQAAVLLWRPNSDESLVQPSLEQAAQFLNVEPQAVVDAIEQGELLADWFVDWEVTKTV